MSHLQFSIYGALIALAGLIDSIAGGGGLITVPCLTLILGPGADTIGTNKIFGLAAATVALVVYARRGYLDWRGSVPFLIGVLGGTVVGAKVAGVLPASLFKWFLVGICPILLWITFQRDSLVPSSHSRPARPYLRFFLGVACGFYDGVFGPGGGTFMFLALVFGAGLPLMSAIATSKLANALSAGGSLVTYALDQHVRWEVGLGLVPFIVVGAWIGSQLASRQAQLIVRPMLAAVVTLLLIRVLVTI